MVDTCKAVFTHDLVDRTNLVDEAFFRLKKAYSAHGIFCGAGTVPFSCSTKGFSDTADTVDTVDTVNTLDTADIVEAFHTVKHSWAQLTQLTQLTQLAQLTQLTG